MLISAAIVIGVSTCPSFVISSDAQVLAAPTISIGSKSLAIDGVNIERKTNQLIAYTLTTAQAVTPTNVHGAEVVVSDGKVAAVMDRLVTRASAPTIPVGSVVLSGHGSARQWLVDYAKVGSTVVLPAALLPEATGTTSSTPPAQTTSDVVAVGGRSHRVNGINVQRNTDQLIVFTHSGSQASTPTNAYGAEVVVTSGKVAEINDRLANGRSPTPIPPAGYVLSGHGESRQWLIENARVGLTVVPPPGLVPRSPSIPPTSSAPTPPPTPSSMLPATRPLPDNVSAMWWNIWQGPTLGQLPASVVDTNNVYIAAIAQSAQAGTGKLRWSPEIQHRAHSKSEITAMSVKGNLIILGIGGSADGGITVTNATTVKQFVDSVQSLVNTYGFQGIDLDLEPSGSSWTEASVVSAVSQLKAKYGKNFAIGLTVGLYGEHTARWYSLAKALGNNYDYWAPMLYDFPEAHDSRLTAVALDKVRQAVDAGIPASKQVLGFMCNAYYNTSPVHVTIDAYNAVRKEFPSIRGAFIWESSIEAAHGYAWTFALGNQIRQGN